GTLDWRPTIYTISNFPPGTKDYNAGSNPNGNDGSFYHSRLQAIPVPDSTPGFDLLSTAGTGVHQLKFTDTNIYAPGTTFDWSQITSGAVTSGGKTRDFSTDTINYIDFTLGANQGGGTESGRIDGITFTLKNGESVTLDLSAVPLPSAAWMGLSLIAGL